MGSLVILIVFALALTVAGTAVFWTRSKTGAQRPEAPASDTSELTETLSAAPGVTRPRVKDTVVREKAFQLRLPGEWIKEQLNDPARFSYHAVGGKEALTVSLVAFGSPLSEEEQQRTAEKLTEIHRRVQSKPAGVTRIILTDTMYGESGNVLSTRYSGLEPARHRRFHSLLLCTPTVAAMFYYEAVDLSYEESLARARTIMDTIGITKK